MSLFLGSYYYNSLLIPCSQSPSPFCNVFALNISDISRSQAMKAFPLKQPKIHLFHFIHKHCYRPRLCTIAEYDRAGRCRWHSLPGVTHWRAWIYLFSCFPIYQDKADISCWKWFKTAVLWQKVSHSWLRGIPLFFQVLSPNNKQAQQQYWFFWFVFLPSVLCFISVCTAQSWLGSISSIHNSYRSLCDLWKFSVSSALVLLKNFNRMCRKSLFFA